MLGELLGCWNIGQEPLIDIGPVDDRNSGSGPVFGDWNNNGIRVMPDGPELLMDQHQLPLPLAPLGFPLTEHIVGTNLVNCLDKAADEEITYRTFVLLQGFS